MGQEQRRGLRRAGPSGPAVSRCFRLPRMVVCGWMGHRGFGHRAWRQICAGSQGGGIPVPHLGSVFSRSAERWGWDLAPKAPSPRAVRGKGLGGRIYSWHDRDLFAIFNFKDVKGDVHTDCGKVSGRSQGKCCLFFFLYILQSLLSKSV